MLLALLLLTGCGGPRWHADYEYGIKTVRVGDKKVSFVDKDTQQVFADDNIRIRFSFGPTRIGFKLENLTKNSIKVIWDESVFMDSDGTTMRVMHEGVRFMEKGKSMPPSIIGPGGNIDDTILPADLTTFTGHVWTTERIFPDGYFDEFQQSAFDEQKDSLRRFVEYSKGRDLFGVMLTLQLPSGKKEYTFQFYVSKAELTDTEANKH